MKTERRHELETNVLADSLGHLADAERPYGKTVLAAVIAVIVALLAWTYISSQNKTREIDGWNGYFQAVNNRDEQMLQDVTEQFSGTKVAQWARLTLGDWRLDNGTNRLLADRKIASDQLREASETYQALLLQTNESTIQQRATFGLARAREALGDLDKARADYQSLAEKWPDSPFAAVSKKRAAELEKLPTKQFYDWLAAYEPPRSLSNEPGTPGARPDFLKEPDAGTLTPPSSLGDSNARFPGLLDEPSSEAPASTPELPGAAEPQAGETSPAAEAPAAETKPEGETEPTETAPE